MKLFLTALIIFVFTLSVSAQDYILEQKEITRESKQPKWELNIKYPQIKNPVNESEVIFNLIVKQQAIAEKDSFIVQMQNSGVDENYKDERGVYYSGDTVYFYDNKIISVNTLIYSEIPGAAHPGNWTTCLNYDLEKNKEIKLTDLFSGEYVKAISGYCVLAITKQRSENEPILAKPDEWTLNIAGPKEENFRVFNFTQEGFLITFSSYKYTVLIPYDNLREFAIKGGQYERFLK